MSTLTATVTADDPLPYIAVDAVIDDPSTVTNVSIWRISAVGTVLIVYQSAVEDGGVLLYDDKEAPLGVAVTYKMTITAPGSSWTLYSAPVMITGTSGCFLSDPYSGQVMAIEVQSWPARAKKGRRAVLEVIGRTDPVVISDVHTLDASTPVLLTRTTLDYDKMIDILTYSGVVLLRTQPGSSLKTVYASVGDINEERYTNSGTDQTRLTSVDFQEITGIPATARGTAATLTDLATLADTLEGLAQVRPTLLQLAMMRF